MGRIGKLPDTTSSKRLLRRSRRLPLDSRILAAKRRFAFARQAQVAAVSEPLERRSSPASSAQYNQRDLGTVQAPSTWELSLLTLRGLFSLADCRRLLAWYVLFTFYLPFFFSLDGAVGFDFKVIFTAFSVPRKGAVFLHSFQKVFLDWSLLWYSLTMTLASVIVIDRECSKLRNNNAAFS